MNKLKDCRYGKVIYNDQDIYIGKAFEKYGEYSQGEVDFLKQIVQQGDVVLDVGANIGGLTMPLSEMVGKNGRVFAFEPQRWVFYMLCGNVAMNNMDNVYCINCAAGDKMGSITLPEINYDVEGNYGSVMIKNPNWDQKGITYAVQLITLDSLCESLKKCNVIKIDVEGMESEVLKGAKLLIEKFKPFLYVENDRIEYEGELTDLIESYGYELHEHWPAMYNENNFFEESENIYDDTASKNLLCVHKSLGVHVVKTTD